MFLSTFVTRVSYLEQVYVFIHNIYVFLNVTN